MYKIIADALESAADYIRRDKHRCSLVAEMRATLQRQSMENMKSSSTVWCVLTFMWYFDTD
jgi:hypothetical protein